MNPYLATGLQAIGVFIMTIVTGLAVYQSPPESLDQFWQWAWKPGLQAILMTCSALGINSGINRANPQKK